MEEPIKIGQIGVGGIGGKHLQCLAMMEKQGRARLVAVADPGRDRLQQQWEELNGRGVRWHGDYREMIGKEELDAVVIATPIPLHFEMTQACMERGLFVSLEKPPAPLIQQLEELIALEKEPRVAVGFQMICSEEVQQIKRWIVEGELGKVEEIRIGACWPRMDGYYNRAAWAGRMVSNGKPVFDGPATNALSHLIHDAMYFGGRTHEGFGRPARVQAELYRVRPIESYDTVCMRGELEEGAAFVAALTHATEEPQPYQVEVRGTRDWARISRDGTRLERSSGLVWDRPGQDGFPHLYANFLDFCGGKIAQPATRLADARGYVLATNGALLSSGGIHPVREGFARTYEKKGDHGFDLPGLRDYVGRVFLEGRLFSELGAPWAVKTEPVDVTGLRTLDLEI